jgi:DNA-binding NtrC family response regulator
LSSTLPLPPPTPTAPLAGLSPAATPAGSERVIALEADSALPFKEAKEKLLDEFEAAYFRRLFAHSNGNVSAIARAAGIDRKHLYTLMKKHGLESRDGVRRSPGEE